jgi:hypothetical protein
MESPRESIRDAAQNATLRKPGKPFATLWNAALDDSSAAPGGRVKYSERRGTGDGNVGG